MFISSQDLNPRVSPQHLVNTDLLRIGQHNTKKNAPAILCMLQSFTEVQNLACNCYCREGKCMKTACCHWSSKGSSEMVYFTVSAQGRDSQRVVWTKGEAGMTYRKDILPAQGQKWKGQVISSLHNCTNGSKGSQV